jgi:hypothetical protein
MSRQGYTEGGVTVRHVRRMICDAIPSNPVLLKAIEDAAGGNLVALLGAVHMTGHGADLNMAFETYDDQAGRIWIDVQLDTMRGGDISLWDREKPIEVDRVHVGLERVVTIAPYVWFQHTGNAKSAVNPLYLDDLILTMPQPLSTVFFHGVSRAMGRFKLLAKPKREVPRWVYATR